MTAEHEAREGAIMSDDRLTPGQTGTPLATAWIVVSS